jgi:hypothetical protein
MDPKWYAVALGSFIISSIAACAVLSITKLARTYGKTLFFKQLYYPQIPRQLRFSGKTTRFDVLILVLFLAANVYALKAGVNDTSSFIRRSGLLAVINMVPLFLGGQMNLIASHCGIGLRGYTRMHRWLGRVSAAEGLLHSIVALSIIRPDLHNQRDIAAIVVRFQSSSQS